jgi:hypothetical protein
LWDLELLALTKAFGSWCAWCLDRSLFAISVNLAYKHPIIKAGTDNSKVEMELYKPNP